LQNAPNDGTPNNAANAPARPPAVTHHKPAKPPSDDGEGGGRRERLREDIRRRFHDARHSTARRHTSADYRPAKPPSEDDEGGGRTDRVLGGMLRRVSDSAAHQKPAGILFSDEQESREKRESFLTDMRPRVDFVRRRIEMMHAGEAEFEEYMESLERTADKNAEDREDEEVEQYLERLSKDAEG